MDYGLPGSSVRGILPEYLSGLPSPSAGDLPDPGINSGSSAWQADSLPSEPPGKPVIQIVKKKKKYPREAQNSKCDKHDG